MSKLDLPVFDVDRYEAADAFARRLPSETTGGNLYDPKGLSPAGAR